MAEIDGNFNEVGNEDYVAHEYSELLPQRADDEQSNQEKQREEPQVTSVNGRESNVRDAVCAESVSQSTSLESGDPQPVTFETDNHRQLQQRAPVLNICPHSEQTPYEGFLVLLFVTVKWISADTAAYSVVMIPNSNQQLMEEICQQESESCKDRRLSFLLDNTEMRDFLTLYLGSDQHITVSFQMENQQQENFVGQELGCKQFDGLQIRSQSESRLPSKGAKASFYVRYRGREGVPCQVQGKITITIELHHTVVNGPAKNMNLLFSISN